MEGGCRREVGRKKEETMQPKVKSFMTGSPVTIEADLSALAALDLMIDHGIRHLPVVDGQRRVVGIVSFDDLRAAFPIAISLVDPPGLDDRPVLRDILVGEVMTHAPVTIREDQLLEEAAQVMADLRIGCLPLVDADGRIDGILSETDLLQALVTTLWAQRRPAHEGEPHAGLGIVEVLRAERDRIVSRLEGYEHYEQEITQSERAQVVDEGDRSTDRADAALTQQLADMAAQRLRSIEHALDRAGRGELSRCERCEGEIPEARLRALPSTTLCVRCAREAEGKSN
jgi:acetoin utilization protein AcuB